MASLSQATTATLDAQDSPTTGEVGKADLSFLPPIYILPTHIEDDHRHDLEDHLLEAGAPLTYDIFEARLVLGNVGTKRRAELELRVRRLWTEAIEHEANDSSITEPPLKRMRRDSQPDIDPTEPLFAAELAKLNSQHVYLLRLEWLEYLLAGQESTLR